MSKKQSIEDIKLSDIKKEAKAKKRENSKTRATIRENWDLVTATIKNIAEFLDASFLAIVSLFAMYMAYYHYHLNHWTEIILFISGGAMVLRAFALLAKHFARRGE